MKKFFLICYCIRIIIILLFILLSLVYFENLEILKVILKINLGTEFVIFITKISSAEDMEKRNWYLISLILNIFCLILLLLKIFFR